IDDDTYYNNFSKPKDITYISSMTESAQAHYISQWISENHRIEAGAKTAIVLCDESLLQTVLHCLPEEVKSINITTGYPLSQSPVASFIQILLRLQTYGHVKNTDKYRLRDVAKILKHPYGQYISDSCLDLYKELQTCNRYYPTRSQLAIDQGLQLLFTDIDTQGDCHNQNIAQWLTAMLQYVGRQASKVNDPLTQESIFRMYTIINRLEGLITSGDLQVDKITFERLIAQLIQSTTVPFRGEPIEGIQIMGVLETRNLDFDHLLVLSASDNNMPKGVNDSSFIPYSIRKAYGLTTIDHKVAIYAYYFYRLLQRSQDITLTYNKATEDGQTGEMSRFMLQMMVESGHDIHHGILTPDQSVKQALSGSVIK
ncbi:MAG: PD-(D/E)XK nuclease family protein, partial [Prevotella sp.]|nr:PD-(D/E)XK nuclease family protein [Prevotella sp.]